MVDLNRIESFLHAAESLNFSEAARTLHLTQPTVSHHIKNLEQELGVELFKRQDGTIKLTEAGRLLVPWARRMMQNSIEMQEMMDSIYILPAAQQQENMFFLNWQPVFQFATRRFKQLFFAVLLELLCQICSTGMPI
jgi:DNA-binding transcriptional ArsR family regulator